MSVIRRQDIPPQFNIPGRKLKNMNCIYCQRTFFIKDPYRIKGSRVPVLRYCGHTMCEDCSKDLTKLDCSRCENNSTTSTSQPRIPAINFYAVGLMFAQDSRPIGIANTKDDEFNFQKSAHAMIRQTSQCCNECKDVATCRCVGCSQFYCDECFGKIHAFQSLKSHAKVLLKHKENTPPQLVVVCEDHTPNILKHWCRECNVKCCTDCIVYEHRTHSTIEIQKMNELCQKEFTDAYEALANVIGQVRNAKKEVTAALKLPEEEDNSAKVESEINQHFLYLHGILQNLESQMIEILHAQSNGRLRNLIEIQEELQYLETQVEHGILLAGLAKKKSESVNHMSVIKELKDLTNVRCYLLKRPVNNKNKESIMFHADESIVAAIENHCIVNTKPLPKLFSLVTADELPQDYMIQTVARESLSIPSLSAPTAPSNFSPSMDPKVENCAASVSSNSSIPVETQSRKGYEVHVTFIANPYRFYVREKSTDHLYEEIEHELEKYSTRNELIPETVSRGKVYVVQGRRHKWYRGRVQSIITSDARHPIVYEMYAIDHGFVHRVEKPRLRTLLPKISDIKPLVKKHKLFDIFPINGKSWSSESIEEMRNIVNIALEKLPRLYEVNDEAQVGSDLLIPTSIHNDALSVRDTLLFLGHGKFESTEKLLKLNPSASNVYHHDQVELGKYYEIICLHVESPKCFYVRKADYNEDYFQKMIIDMTADYKSTKKLKSLIYNPVIGLNCAAPHNGSWHRGVISNIPEVKKIEVFFVDLGLKSTMDYDKIRRLDPCYTRAITRAIKLSLDNIEIPNGDMRPDIKNMMIEFMDPTAKMIASAKTEDGYIAFLRDRVNISLRYVLNANHYVGDRVALSLTNKSGNSPTKTKSKSRDKKKNDNRNRPDLYEFITSNQSTSQKKTIIKPQHKQDPYLCPVNVQHVVSPDEIYLTTTNRTETFDEIHDKMQKFYTKLKSKGSPDMSKGAMCAIRLPRNSAYYRAKIVTINDDNMKVFCIDEGTHEIIPRHCIQSLAPELHEIPAFLFKVRLGGIHPTCGKSTWTSLACEKLIEIINCNETKNFFIAKVGDPVNEAMTVDLYVEQARITDAISPPVVEKNIINRMLVEEGLALPIRDYNDNKLKVLAEDVKKEMKFYDKSVVEQVPEHFNSNTDASQDSEDFINDPAPDMSRHFPSGIPTWLPAEYIPKNSFRARTTYIDWDGFIYLHPVEQIAALATIDETLQNLYAFKEVCETDQWSPGDMCMVKYHGTSKWCRGVVHEVRKKYISVEFVDYGDLEWQERQSLSKDLVLKDVPRIATKCQIYGLISNSPNGIWNPKELYDMHSIVVDKECTVTILRRNEGYNVIKVNCIDGLKRDLIAHLVYDKHMNICLDNINLDFNSDVDSNCSADIYTALDGNVDQDDDDSADVVIEGTIEDYTDENVEDDDIESTEFTKNTTDCMGTPKSTDESTQDNDIVRTTVDAMIKNVLESEELKRSLINNSDRSYKKIYINEVDCDEDDDDDYSGDIEEDYFENDERICQALLPDEYRSILKDFQLPNNDGKYTQLILPDEITEFLGAIGEVDLHESNIVWLHPSETKSCSVLNYYRAAYKKLQIAMDLEADQQPLLEDINSGTPCCALYNGIWHRGSIVSPVILSGMIEVLYVDWGNIGLVDVNQIYTMKKEWFDLPTLAIKCRLWGARIADNAKAKTWFQFKRDNSKELYRIEIVGRELDRAIVKIFEEDSDERLMYQDLIDQKIFLNNLKDHFSRIV